MANERRVRVNDGRGVADRKIPIRHHLIGATTLAGAETFYTVREGVALEVTGLSAVNTSGAAVTLSVHSVHPDETRGTGTTELKQFSIQGNTAVDLTSLIGGLYEAETQLLAFASAPNAVNIHGKGSELL